MTDLYSECSKCLPPVFKSVDASMQKLAKAGGRLKKHPYENLNIFKSA